MEINWFVVSAAVIVVALIVWFNLFLLRKQKKCQHSWYYVRMCQLCKKTEHGMIHDSDMEEMQ